jgi:hypothetical protein
VPRLGTSRQFTSPASRLPPSRLDKPSACPHTHRPDDDLIFVVGGNRTRNTKVRGILRILGRSGCRLARYQQECLMVPPGRLRRVQASQARGRGVTSGEAHLIRLTGDPHRRFVAVWRARERSRGSRSGAVARQPLCRRNGSPRELLDGDGQRESWTASTTAEHVEMRSVDPKFLRDLVARLSGRVDPAGEFCFALTRSARRAFGRRHADQSSM